ncbi:MAG: hypothetical protein Q9166_007397 [cf. Caloplaca sp. 2 TL-2023]
MPTSLEDLPTELLGHILLYNDEVQGLLCLALSSKKLHDFIQTDGYRVFVQSHYPWIPIPPSWKDAAHALTKLSRAWDRKAVIPRYIKPTHNARRAQHPGRRGRGQTMGYQPVIDSYETWTGPDWTSRREAVTWGAGAELVIRIKWMGPDVEQEWRQARKHDRTDFDQHHHKSRWWRILEPPHVDGKDDITALKLLQETQKPSGKSEYVIVGRASGGLDLISIDHGIQTWNRETQFETEGQSVRSASVNVAVAPLLAACLGDRTIAIYQVSTGIDLTKPLGKIQFDSLESPCRLWTTIFLRHDRLAVSLGPHLQPIQVFDVRPEAISSEPIRRFSFARSTSIISAYAEDLFSKPTTAYPLVPLPRSSCLCESEGDLFLSGGYDGVIRLHDLRSPASYVATFHDPVDSTAAIYSLLPLGRDRFLAGSAQFATIKLFNMRTAVEKLCRHVNCGVASAKTQDHVEQNSLQSSGPRDWTVFLANREGPFGAQSSRNSWHPREWTSPVYSLSSPSLCSPTFFAGIEGHVIQVDVTSAYDRFPDPIYKYGLEDTGRRDEDAARKWDPSHDVMCVDSYEHVHTSIKIMHQARIGERKQGNQIPGWDERWYSRGGKVSS